QVVRLDEASREDGLHVGEVLINRGAMDTCLRGHVCHPGSTWSALGETRLGRFHEPATRIVLREREVRAPCRGAMPVRPRCRVERIHFAPSLFTVVLTVG